MYFGFALELSDIDLWNTDLLDTHLDLLSPDKYTDIPSKYFVCLHKIFKTSSRHVLKTSSRHVFKTSSRHVFKTSSRYVFNTFSRYVFKISSRHVFKTSSRYVFKTSSRLLQCNNFSSSKTPWRRLQDVLQEVFKTSLRCLQDVLEDVKLLRWRCVEDVIKTCLEDVLKTSSRPANVCWAATRVFIKWEQNYIEFRPFQMIITHILISWFKTFESRQQTQKAKKDEKLVFEKK